MAGQMPPECSTTGCSQPTWNGLPGSFCSLGCRNTTPSMCASGCGKASWNRKPGEFCSRTCRSNNNNSGLIAAQQGLPLQAAQVATSSALPGQALSQQQHQQQQQLSFSFARCASAACPCTASWNGLLGAFCCKKCAAGEACASLLHSFPSALAPLASPVLPMLSAGFAKCANPACACTASFSGNAGDYCCKACRRGIPCGRNVHTAPQAPASSAANLCVAGCGRPTHNGLAGEFCGKTCRQTYAQQTPKASLFDYAAIKAQADLWARKVWPAGLGRISQFHANPGLGDPTCPAAKKYKAGVGALRCADTSQAEFAWHGTGTLAGVQSICWDSLNPALRRGQAYGPGEYFSVDANVSNGHAGSTGYLVVCLLLTGPHKTTHASTYRVVNNPQTGTAMYCLPVGVVDYRRSGDPQLKGSG
ncbi:unnamed protein product [Polarella glacialis]|uniref:PARP catalytic domain-containing protein n=1 Tax=Polarella glacialis TaxID=89957 RepID=A0A813I2D3_POLGL|nr:unnamed protein product [Polarella glacialis]